MKKHQKRRESREGDRSFNEKRLCENLPEKFKAHQVPFEGMIDVNLLVLKMFPSASDFTSAARSTLVLRRRMPGDVKIHGPSFHHGPQRAHTHLKNTQIARCDGPALAFSASPSPKAEVCQVCQVCRGAKNRPLKHRDAPGLRQFCRLHRSRSF